MDRPPGRFFKELAGIAIYEAFKSIAWGLAVFLGGWIGERSAYVNGVVLAYEHRAWLTELFPRNDEFAVLIEDLNAVVFTIGDIDEALRPTDENVVRLIEVTGGGSQVSPGLDELSVLGKFNDARVGFSAVSVGNVDFSVQTSGDSGRPVERVHAGSGDPRLAECKQNVSIGA